LQPPDGFTLRPLPVGVNEGFIMKKNKYKVKIEATDYSGYDDTYEAVIAEDTPAKAKKEAERRARLVAEDYGAKPIDVYVEIVSKKKLKRLS
jgi:hypothetical protein